MSRRPHPNHRPAASLPSELRRPRVPPEALAWVERSLGRTVERSSRLDGASSTAVHRLRLGDGGSLVLRRYAWRGYLDAEPDAPAREVDALRHAVAAGLPAPEVVAVDLSGGAVGDGIPALVMTFLPGGPVVDPDPHALAEVAARIHAVDPAGLPHDWFPWYEAEMVTPPPTSAQPRLWERAIDVWRHRRPAFEPRFVHRDLHPGNVLWRRGVATGIVDWPNGCRGPTGCDVAHCRANVRTWDGPAAAAAFVAAYESLTGRALDPYWVLAGTLEHDHAHWTPANLPDAEADLEAALAALG